MRTRYAFAGAFLACFGVTGLVYSLLDPGAQARLVDWASTNVENLEHEPVLPLLLSAFVAPGYLATWPVLIALALFGANRALGNGRLALVFPGAIFGGLSQLDVAAVGHLTAMLTAAVLVGVIMLRRRNASGGDLADGGADAVGDRGRGGAQDQLADRAAPERAVGQPGHQPPAGHGGDGGEPERDA
jgi:hypothetical protein